ncbi:MAG: hypothetical protein Q7J77_03065 [Undibacterium sp.]|nr:hypothetical protein [Undibacterium sp.]
MIGFNIKLSGHALSMRVLGLPGLQAAWRLRGGGAVLYFFVETLT